VWGSWRLDATDIRVQGAWQYLDRATENGAFEFFDQTRTGTLFEQYWSLPNNQDQATVLTHHSVPATGRINHHRPCRMYPVVIGLRSLQNYDMLGACMTVPGNARTRLVT
jgi:hypothetical protein